MSISSAQRQEVVAKFARSPGDVGSVEVQVALLSRRIENLGGHFSDHKKDFHSRRGLLLMISKRRRLLDYLQRRDEDRYRNLISQLGLRR